MLLMIIKTYGMPHKLLGLLVLMVSTGLVKIVQLRVQLLLTLGLAQQSKVLVVQLTKLRDGKLPI
jgi:hypothetical protein